MRYLIATLALFATSAATTAQDRGDPIIVKGAKPDKQADKKAAHDFVRATGVAQGNTSAARWGEPVCPRAIGVTLPGAATLVETRIRDTATAAGIAVAPVGCTPNLAVTFVGDARATMRQVARRDSRRLSSVPMQDRSSLIEGTAPIRWWYAIATEARDGMSGHGGNTASAIAAGNGGGAGYETAGRDSIAVVQQPRASLISTLGARVIRSATVVIDVPAADGIPLEAVASYAAMVALAELRPTARTPDDSILGLFADPTPPRLPTERDITLLRTIYAMPLDRTAMRHRGLVARGLTQPPQP